MRVGPIEDLSAWAESAREIVGERQLVCSVSGGKDSTTVALLLKEAGLLKEREQRALHDDVSNLIRGPPF